MSVFALALLWAAPAEAKKPRSEAPIVLPCAWDVGDTWSYAYVRSRTDVRTPELAEVTTTTDLTITVLAVEGERTVFSYAAGAPRVDGPPELAAAVAEALGSTTLPALEIVMEGSRLVDVRNLQEVVTAIEPILRRSLPADADPEALEFTMRSFRDPIGGPQLLLAEPNKLFALHCSSMAPGESRGGPSATPNPFGGPPIEAQSKVWVTEYDKKARTFAMATDDRTDPDAAKAMVESVLAKVAPGVEGEERAAALSQLPPVITVMTGAMVYSTRDGFPLSVEVVTSVVDDAQQTVRSNTMIWTRLDR